AGAVPGRCGACLAVRTSPATFQVERIFNPANQNGLKNPSYESSVTPFRGQFLAGASAQCLQHWQRCAVAQEVHRSVGEGEVGTARMAAAEGATPITKRLDISPGWHSVVDRRSGVKREFNHDSQPRDPAPLPNLSEGNCSGYKDGSAEFPF